MTLDDIDIISNEGFGERGYPHEEWALLRREAPVWWNDRHVTHPFWAVTRHEDIVSISRQPLRFRNGPRLAVFPKFGPPPEGQEPYRHLLHMDPPEHGLRRSGRAARRDRGARAALALRLLRGAGRATTGRSA